MSEKVFLQSDILLKCGEVQAAFEYFKWSKEVPALQFKPEWKVRITPPIGLVVARFEVEYKGAFVSVFLDCYDLAGTVNPLETMPYWEVYPSFYDGRPCRVLMKEGEQLIQVIHESLEKQIREKADPKGESK